MTIVRALRLASVVALSLVAPFLTTSASAQSTGRIVGRILDGASGAPLAGAQVAVVGSTIGVTTTLDGRFILMKAPADEKIELRVRKIGYQPKSVAGVIVPAGGGIEQDITLNSEVFQLEEITVEASAERGTVSSAMNEIRLAPSMMNSLPAELMRKTPDSDAGQAVQRVAGVSVQDGKYVLVRGLGERYTTTSLNSARIPSPEPERKVVPLDLFPSSLLEAITTSKTFTPEQPGDFSGAQVNLKTREFPLGRKISFSTSAAYNDAATGRTIFKAPTVGQEWLGFAGSARQMPTGLANITTLSGQTTGSLNNIMASFRDVWTARQANGRPNTGFGLSVGGEDPMFGQPVGYLASLTYSMGDDVRLNERRAISVTGSGGTVRPENEYRGSTGTTGVLWGGLFNLSTRPGSSTKLSMNNAYTRGGDNQATHMAGFNEDLGRTFDITRLTFTERTVRSTQLVGEHLLGGRHTLDWSATTSGVSRYEPDRSDLVYEANVDTTTGASQPTMWMAGARSATRTFSDLAEDALDGAANFKLVLGDARSSIKVGMFGRMADRDADTRAFDLLGHGLTDAEKSQAAETVLGPTNALAGKLFLSQNANGGKYTASERLFASYAQLDLAFATRFRLVGGARLERALIRVNTVTAQGAGSFGKLDDIDVLPSLALSMQLTDRQNLRLSATQTLSRPEYREMSDVAYSDILGGYSVKGNAKLVRALIQNVDMRWEMYPGHNEVLSVAVFGKHFTRPIEKILVGGTGAPQLSFENAKGAWNYGVEFEVRKGLGFVTESWQSFSVFANTTLMQSTIETDSLSQSSNTNKKRPMVGQSKYVANAGLAYAHPAGRLNATVLYNVVGRRISEAGLLPRPDTYEEARNVVDASIELPFVAGGQLKLDAKNLLNAPYRATQGSVIRSEYRTGRTFGMGLSWTF